MNEFASLGALSFFRVDYYSQGIDVQQSEQEVTKIGSL